MVGVPEAWQKQAEQVIQKLSEHYPETASAELKEAEDVFKAGQSLPQDQRFQEYQTTFFRLIHNLKGQGGTFGYPLVTEVGNHLCRYIERQKKFEEKENACIARHLVILKAIIDKRLTGDGGSKGQALKQEIEEIK